jgi:fermentation-respiration switch protein FrsA (DUF1100 family)
MESGTATKDRLPGEPARRRRRPKRLARAILMLVAVAAFVGAAPGLILGYCFVHPPRQRIRRTPARFGLRFERVKLTSADGTRLAAWYVPGPVEEGPRGRPAAAVVLCHGYPSNREDVLDLIPALHHAGFHVLAFDFRSLGESDGGICTLGREEPQDVLAAVAFLRARREVDPSRIGVLGTSMGAACSLIAAARSDAICAVVADSAFARLDWMVEERLRPLPAIVRRPLASSSRWWAERFAGCSAAEVSPLAVVPRIAPRPILFIHGGADELIPVAHARLLYAASLGPAVGARHAGPRSTRSAWRSLWIVPDARHAQCHGCQSEAYERRVVAFFRRFLAPTPRGR